MPNLDLDLAEDQVSPSEHKTKKSLSTQLLESIDYNLEKFAVSSNKSPFAQLSLEEENLKKYIKLPSLKIIYHFIKSYVDENKTDIDKLAENSQPGIRFNREDWRLVVKGKEDNLLPDGYFLPRSCAILYLADEKDHTSPSIRIVIELENFSKDPSIPLPSALQKDSKLRDPDISQIDFLNCQAIHNSKCLIQDYKSEGIERGRLLSAQSPTRAPSFFPILGIDAWSERGTQKKIELGVQINGPQPIFIAVAGPRDKEVGFNYKEAAREKKLASMAASQRIAFPQTVCIPPDVSTETKSESQQESNQARIYMPLANREKGPSLFDLMVKVKEGSIRLTDADWMYIIYQLISKLKKLHKLGILHRDLKSKNILIGKDLTVYLGDFGTARKINETDDKKSNVPGTYHYLSPEDLITAWSREKAALDRLLTVSPSQKYEFNFEYFLQHINIHYGQLEPVEFKEQSLAYRKYLQPIAKVKTNITLQDIPHGLQCEENSGYFAGDVWGIGCILDEIIHVLNKPELHQVDNSPEKLETKEKKTLSQTLFPNQHSLSKPKISSYSDVVQEQDSKLISAIPSKISPEVLPFLEKLRDDFTCLKKQRKNLDQGLDDLRKFFVKNNGKFDPQRKSYFQKIVLVEKNRLIISNIEKTKRLSVWHKFKGRKSLLFNTYKKSVKLNMEAKSTQKTYNVLVNTKQALKKKLLEDGEKINFHERIQYRHFFSTEDQLQKEELDKETILSLLKEDLFWNKQNMGMNTDFPACIKEMRSCLNKVLPENLFENFLREATTALNSNQSVCSFIKRKLFRSKMTTLFLKAFHNKQSWGEVVEALKTNGFYEEYYYKVYDPGPLMVYTKTSSRR